MSSVGIHASKALSYSLGYEVRAGYQARLVQFPDHVSWGNIAALRSQRSGAIVVREWAAPELRVGFSTGLVRLYHLYLRQAAAFPG